MTVETINLDFLFNRQIFIRYLLSNFSKEVFTDNFHMFRLWEYLKCFDYVNRTFSKEDKFVLVDIGSCRSYFPFLIAKMYPRASVYATDIASPWMYYKGDKPEIPQNLYFKAMFLEQLRTNFSRKSIDVVTCISVLEHVDKDLEGFTGLNRVLKPEGRALFTTDIDLINPTTDPVSRRYDEKYLNQRLQKVQHECIIDLKKEEQIERIEYNKKKYLEFDIDIRKEVELFDLSYLAGYFEYYPVA